MNPPPRFLSAQWSQQAREALRSNDTFREIAACSTFRLWLVAKDPPPWAQNITVILNNKDVEIDLGTTGRPSAVGQATYADWLAMLRHELHPRRAVLTGRLSGKGPFVVLRNYKTIDAALDVLRTIPVAG